MTTEQIIFGLAVWRHGVGALAASPLARPREAGGAGDRRDLRLRGRAGRRAGHSFNAYLQALEIRPAELVQTLGIVLCATSLMLTVSLLNFGLIDGPHALLSAAAMAPSTAGMWIGQRVRAGLSVEQFRVAVFAALALTGLYTVLSRLL